MAGRRITTTRSVDLQALGSGGSRAVDAWATLTTLLAGELSPAHAALLAEPQQNTARGEVDWYAPLAGTPQPLAAADAAARAAAEAELARLRAGIEALAARLEGASDGASRLQAALLRQAMQVPEPLADQVWLLGTQPVLVAWGHARHGAAGGAAPIQGQRSLAEAPMAILPPPPGPGRRPVPLLGWLAALAASLLLLLAVLLLLWRDPWGWMAPPATACAVDPATLSLLGELRDAAAREGVIRRELAALVAEAGQRRTTCEPPPAPPPPPAPQPAPQPAPPPPPQPTPPPPPQPRNEDLERAQREGGRSGALQIVLAWDDRSDLDLHVICPNGQRIFWDNRRACGGELDVDANGGRGTTATPVENTRWERPAPGTYRVEVNNYEPRGRDASPFRVTIRQQGRPDRVVTGVARAGGGRQPVTVVEVTP